MPALKKLTVLVAGLLLCSIATYLAIKPAQKQSIAQTGTDQAAQSADDQIAIVADNDTNSARVTTSRSELLTADQKSTPAAKGTSSTAENDPMIRPLLFDAIQSNQTGSNSSPQNKSDTVLSVNTPEGPDSPQNRTTEIPESDDEIVAVINNMLTRSWAENEIQPLPDAPSDEWLRRAWLSFAGSIPPADIARNFIASSSHREKRRVISQLVAADQTFENMAVIWVNLMIGRSNQGEVDEEALFEFMRQKFANNEPWLDTVCELMSAEGRSDQNGATNFLLAHLNNQATPATAVTAKLFLGQQVQCTQCHDHPFSRNIHQDEFWSLNAFFKQTRREPIQVAMVDGKRQQIWKLADTDKGGMTFYETLRGQQVAVLPEFAGERLTAEDGVHRRSELVRLVRNDPQHRVARAMVNRVWSHFFGAGFTAPVDDMGPHNPPSHPELLEFLTLAFAKNHYDVRRLMTWIATSNAWQKTSNLSESDAYLMSQFLPEAGGIPLFNQVYPRHMAPEEVYDSLRTSIRSIARQPVNSSLGTTHRREWVSQFVEAYGTDENDEWLQFDGNISQALLMMNGADLQRDISLAVNHLIMNLNRDQLAVSRFLPELSLATVSRMPSEIEQRVFQNRVRQVSRALGPEQALRIAAEDMLWAYLNSSEFIVVH